MNCYSDADVINCRTLGEAWIASLFAVLKYGEFMHDGPEKLIERRHLFLRLHAVESDDQIIKKYYSNERKNLLYEKYFSCNVIANFKISYGKLFFDNLGINQLDWVIDRLNSKRETKSGTIGLHQPGESELSCISILDFKIRQDFLLMTAVYRSQNIFSSQPGNIFAIRHMQQYVAEKTHSHIGSLYLFIISAHIYEKDLRAARFVVNDSGLFTIPDSGI